MSQPVNKAPVRQPPPPGSDRLISLDAYRGFVMLLMVAEVIQIPKLAAQFPNNVFWQAIGRHTQHVAWEGCTLHDLIQPSFSFLVGMALPFSLAKRQGSGQSRWRMTMHALLRSLILILLGVFLRSVGKPQTNWTFEDTLTQIGLGYFFLFLLGFKSAWVQWAAFGGIIAGYWLAWVIYPPAGDTFLSHWQKNANLGYAFDIWFLNLFPRMAPFTGNPGGYLSLCFIPTLATMILGLLAGGWLRSGTQPRLIVLGLCLAGLLGLAIGTALDAAGFCPNVKRIWTPAWVFFSGGWCLIFLAPFYWILEVLRLRWWAFLFVVVGMNSIAMYCMEHLFRGFIASSLQTHLGKRLLQYFGETYEPHVIGLIVFLILWLICFWMYRRKIFLRL